MTVIMPWIANCSLLLVDDLRNGTRVEWVFAVFASVISRDTNGHWLLSIMAQHSLDPEKRVNSKLFKPLFINPSHLYWN